MTRVDMYSNRVDPYSYDKYHSKQQSTIYDSYISLLSLSQTRRPMWSNLGSPLSVHQILLTSASMEMVSNRKPLTHNIYPFADTFIHLVHTFIVIVCGPRRNRTCNLGVASATLSPSEPHRLCVCFSLGAPCVLGKTLFCSPRRTTLCPACSCLERSTRRRGLTR